MIRVVILGQGMGATHFAVGVERIKRGELEPYGVPLAKHDIGYDIKDIEIVASYDVDKAKIGRSIYEIAQKLIGDVVPIPDSLKSIVVREGVHLGSTRGLGLEASGREDKCSIAEAVEQLVDEWRQLKPDVILNVITTEHSKPFEDPEKLERAIKEDRRDILRATHVYAYAAIRYAQEVKPVAFVNVIPIAIANDHAFLKLAEKHGVTIFGDDGATGATPLTADLLEHMAERNRYVKFIVQFNIGGNTDFLALTDPERNKAKEFTKSSIVMDILGYEAPSYIKPTGYLEPLGDKKFVSLHLEYTTFNGLKDELYINARINDSPALAGLMVDLVRLGKLAVDHELFGTVYEVNAFYMKKPGPPEAKSMARILAYHRLLEWLKQIRGGS